MVKILIIGLLLFFGTPLSVIAFHLNDKDQDGDVDGKDVALIAGVIGHNETYCQFAWSPNTEANLAGYKIHYGLRSRDYLWSVTIPKYDTFATVAGLIEGNTYYFAATAFDTEGHESDYSTEVIWTAYIKDKSSIFPLDLGHIPLLPVDGLNITYSLDTAGGTI